VVDRSIATNILANYVPSRTASDLEIEDKRYFEGVSSDLMSDML
jgi:hypothetical protein